MKRKLGLFLVIIFSSLNFAQEGFITGFITDAKTLEPLYGSNILVNELENTGASTDEKGFFKIKVKVGSYSIKVSLVGYTSVIKTDVIVRSGSDAFLNVKLSSTAVELGEVSVTADYFDKSIIQNDLSTVVLSPEEIRRSPGSNQDFQRILQAMPGVSFSTDQTNELLVRGGSPDQNLVIFDNMEIHSTNHYPNEMNSGGPINMVNFDLIEDIQFSTGGFIAKYGDKLSSVMVVTTRDGTVLEPLKYNFNLSMAGAGVIAEGRIDGGRGSWIVSARKSYINLIASSFGLSSIPNYYDAQFKISYNLSQSHKLSWSGIYGNDKIHIEGVPERTDLKYANSSDTTEIENINVKMYQYATGLTLKSLWSNKLISNATISFNNYHDDIFFSYDYTKRNYNNNGVLTGTNILSSRKYFQNSADNGTLDFRIEFDWMINNSNELSFGGSLKTGRYKQTSFIAADSTRFDINSDGVFDNSDLVISRNASTFLNDYKLFDEFKDYVYVNHKTKLFDNRLILNLGVRYDHFTLSDKNNVSPRVSASYYLIQDLTSLNIAYGEYYQTQSYPTYGDRFNTKINQSLENSHARHFVLGFDHILDDGLKLTIEGYNKNFSKLPMQESFIFSNDRTFQSEKRFTIGKQTTYGLDFLLQQKLVKDYYGTISFSRMWSETDDPRVGREGKKFVSGYDYPYITSIIIGKRFHDLRKALDNTNFVIKYLTHILPFSDDMEISIRWRYASGRPYTERTFVTSEQHNIGEGEWTKGTWIETDKINGLRYPAYHRLDFGFSSRYNYEKWSLSMFLSIQNLYNRKNIAFYQYNSDGSIENVYQFAVMPIGGIEIQF